MDPSEFQATNELEFKIKFWPRQRQAFDTDATEVLFGGASRGGKSHFIRAALVTWCLEIPNLQCKIFRRFSEDVLSNHMESETGFKAMLAPLIRVGLVQVVQSEVRFLFNGSLISLHHCQDDDLEKYQGRGTNVLVLDEATQLSEKIIKFLRGWVTMTKEMQEQLPDKYKGKFPRIIYTANPIGQSVGFFRREFVKCRPAFAIEKVGAFKRQYIPSRVQDNPSESTEAAEERLRDVGGESMFQALFHGSWDAPLGDYFPEYDEKRHVIPNFEPPAHWFRFRTFDWGSAEPFACYWWTVADGEQFEVEVDNFDAGYTKVPRKFWFPRGALICYREWYGCNLNKPSQGLGMSNPDIARGIVLRSPMPYEKNLLTLTDSYVFPDRGYEHGQTIAKTFADNGVYLKLGKTARITGWSQLRARLIGKRFDLITEERTPMFYIQEQCEFLREYLPALPRNPNEAKREDAAEHGEATHACDCARLAAMAHEIVVESEKPRIDPALLKNEMTFEEALKQVQRNKSGNNGANW